MTNWPVHARITGPIVMIGFGSIGKGTLPLIERHFNYDKTRFVVIDPEDKDRASARRARHPLHPPGRHQGQLRKHLLKPLLTEGGGQGFCVNLSVDTSSIDIMEFCREIGALYIDTVAEPWPGFYFDPKIGTAGALELRAARNVAGRQAPSANPARHHRGVLLRRQSRHGVLVRQAGAAQRRRRRRAQVQGAEDARGMGQARQEGSASKASISPSATPRSPRMPKPHGCLRQHLVGRRLPVGRHAAGRTRLGHP